MFIMEIVGKHLLEKASQNGVKHHSHLSGIKVLCGQSFLPVGHCKSTVKKCNLLYFADQLIAF